MNINEHASLYKLSLEIKYVNPKKNFVQDVAHCPPSKQEQTEICTFLLFLVAYTVFLFSVDNAVRAKFIVYTKWY